MRSVAGAAGTTETVAEPQLKAAARAEGLRYCTDREPGIRRTRRGRGFIYLDSGGQRVSDAATLARIKSLAVPPAYRDVWICTGSNGHLQATARDARGRKQYRYHPRWRLHRDATKFDRMLEFGRALPRIRKRVARDLRRPGFPRAKVLATVVRLLESTLVRVGNEEYARSNGSFGLTTLRDRHVGFDGNKMLLEFRGKSGVMQRVCVTDPAVARVVRRCLDLPGQELFQWIDAEGARRRVDSNDVNDYLRDAGGGPLTAKDFRTWFATVEALEILRARRARTVREARRHVVQAVASVALRLGNTPSICRKCYIHPMILSAYMAGRLATLNGIGPALALRRLLVPARPKRWRQCSPTARIKVRAMKSRSRPIAPLLAAS